jgi:hypothetical protein
VGAIRRDHHVFPDRAGERPARRPPARRPPARVATPRTTTNACRVYRLPAYAPDLNPAEGIWSLLERTMVNFAAADLDSLVRIVKRKLEKIQYRPHPSRPGALLQSATTARPQPGVRAGDLANGLASEAHRAGNRNRRKACGIPLVRQPGRPEGLANFRTRYIRIRSILFR